MKFQVPGYLGLFLCLLVDLEACSVKLGITRVIVTMFERRQEQQEVLVYSAIEVDDLFLIDQQGFDLLFDYTSRNNRNYRTLSEVGGRKMNSSK